MRRVDVHGEGVSVRLFPTETIALTAPTRFRSTLFGIWIRISVQPAAVFIALSLAFGGLIISCTPPLCSHKPTAVGPAARNGMLVATTAHAKFGQPNRSG